MSKTRRNQHEKEFVRNLQYMFSNVRVIEAFETKTVYSITFADGTAQQVTLHFDED